MDISVQEPDDEIRDIVDMLRHEIDRLQTIAERLDGAITPEPVSQDEYRMQVNMARQWVNMNAPFKKESLHVYFDRYMASVKYEHGARNVLSTAEFHGVAADVLGRSPRLRRYGDYTW